MHLLRTLFHSLVVIALALGGSQLKAAGGTILVVESYHAEYDWDESYTQALKEILGKDYKLEFFRMDTKRLPPEKHPAMADAAWEKYQTLKPVLVILGDDAAVKYLAPRLGKTETPVVFLGVNNNPRVYYDLSASRNITGVLERPLLKRNIIIAQQLVGNAKRVLVLFDTDITAQALLKESFDGKNTMSIEGATVELKLIGDWDTWKQTVLDAKGRYDLVFVGLYQTLKDKSGKPVNADEVVRWTSQNTPVPPFGFWDFSVGSDKTIGGLVLYGREQGKAAASLVQKILSEGVSPAALGPITAEKGNLLFSRKQLLKFKLSLPPELAKEARYMD